MVERGRPLDRDGGLHHHLHARRQPDRAGDELVAGHAHHPPWQPDRARADDAQRPSRHAIRDSVSRSPAGPVRHARVECSGADARARCLRLVWHPDLGGRRRDLCHGGRDPRLRSRRAATPAGARNLRRRVPLLHDLLGRERLVHRPRHGVDQVDGGGQRPVPAARRPGARGLGVEGGARVRADLLPAVEVRVGGRVLAGVRLGPHRDDRLLGHALAQHPRLLAIRQVAA